MIMKYAKYITIVAVLIATISCTISDIDDVNVGAGNNDGAKISVYGQITRFDDCDVNTRANKTPEEAYVSNMALAVFPIKDGALQNCISYGLRDGSNLLFTLDRSEMSKEYADKPFALYIFTNMPNLPKSGWTGSLEELITLALPDPGIIRPEDGFPMVGSLGDNINTAKGSDGKEFILMPMSGNRMELPTVDGTPTDYLNIPMSAIFAKVSFSINVTADQDIASSTLSVFEMTGYKINNLPTAVSFDASLNDEENQSVKDSAVEVALSGVASGGKDSGGAIIEFDFYVPERFVTPAKSIDDVLPDPLKRSSYDKTFDKDQNGYRDEDEKYHQRYKPCLLEGQKPTYITIIGMFRDHQEETYEVAYDIYLGANNYDDFNIKRNNQYINTMTIRGLSSSKDQASGAGAVAIDHRVTVTRSMPLIINFRRETLLDAHFEVRPLRVRPVGDVPSNAKVTVNVLNSDGTANNRPSWVRVEASGSSSHHITSGVSAGTRKYFTTDLVTNELATSGVSVAQNITDKNNKTYWVYIDENTTTTSRSAVIQVSYTYDDKGGVSTTETQDFTIVQNGLYQLTQNGRTYTIENHEEYLYNYDAEDGYGQTEDEGMPWGLSEITISNEHKAVSSSNGEWSNDIQNSISENLRPFYDFYITKYDSANTSGIMHEYAGQAFTGEIYSKSGDVDVLSMDQQADGAVEYCYNRNKRNANGSVATVEWYLPSADEMEDIIVGGFSRFTEFQDNYYWTSQPAYIRNYYHYNGWLTGVTFGPMFEENPAYARATKVNKNIEDNSLEYALSGLNEKYEGIRDNSDFDRDRENLGYYYEMDWIKVEFPLTTTTGTYTTDQYFQTGYWGNYTYYYVHLGHLDDLMQDGYQPRTKYNRVRCAYKKIN